MSRERRERRQSKLFAEQAKGIMQRDMLYWLIPCLLGFLLYIRTVGFGFIFDDRPLIVENPQVQSWNYLPRLLTTHLWSHKWEESPIPQYRPMFSAWLLIVYTVGGLSKWFWHLSSIGFHVLATYLVFRLGHEVLESELGASAAALLFAVHPIHVEPVSWVASCNELLYTTLVLSSLFFFCCASRSNTSSVSSRYWMPLSVVLWTAAIFTKESALPVLVAFFYLAYKRLDPSLTWKERLGRAGKLGLPHFASVAIYFLARFLVIGRVGLEKGEHTWAQVLYSTPSIMVFYLKKLVAPVGLSPFYVNPVLSSPTTQMWITAGLIVLGLGALGWLSIKRSSDIGLASMLLILPMLPVLTGIRTFFDGELAHDRYMYLPSVGYCLFAGMLVNKCFHSSQWSRKMAIAFGAALVVLFLFGSITLAQQKFYADDEAYFKRGIEVGPDNVRVIDYLGEFYAGSGRMKEALAEFNRAHELEPSNSEAKFQLAMGLFNNHQFTVAEPYLQELASQSDSQVDRRRTVLFTLGQTEISLNRFTPAKEVLTKLSTEDESYSGLHGTLGFLYQLQGNIPEAQKEFAREVEVSGDPVARQNAAYLDAVMRGQAPPPPTSSAPKKTAP
jgi:Flp pilus assembly protein TadD